MAIVVGLAIWQVRLTWRLMEQDRNLAAEQSRERLEQTADLAVAQIASSLGEWDLQLRELEVQPQLDASTGTPRREITRVVIARQFVSTSPKKALLFVPDPPPPAVIEDAFENAGRLEFQEQNYQLAIEALRPLTRQHGATGAEAWLRTARLERRLNRSAAALAAYDQLLTETALSPDGVPYALLTAGARAELKPAAGTAQLEFLHRALLEGRWLIRRETFEYYWAEVNRLRGRSDQPPQDSLEFASEVSLLFDRWQRTVRSGTNSEGREAGPDQPLLLWSATPQRLIAFSAPASWLGSSLKLPTNASDIRWHWILSGNKASGAEPHVVRSLADAQLAGKLEFSMLPTQAKRGLNRTLWLGGVALMLLLVLAGAYAIHRGVTRELQVAQLQTDFVSAVSHEFRSPLTSLRGITELLTDDRLANDERRRQSYVFLERETGRLQRLVEDLLDFGRMESGRKQYLLQPHDLFGLVRTAVAEFKEEPIASGCEVQMNLDGRETPVKADEEALRRAIRNLLENALKYSPACRTVWVDGRVDRRHVAISIRDRGMGIETRDQRVIFQKFVRGEAAKKAGIKGTGIGLSMVRQIVQACGGEIQLESLAGFGSTFTIVLPLASDREIHT